MTVTGENDSILHPRNIIKSNATNSYTSELLSYEEVAQTSTICLCFFILAWGGGGGGGGNGICDELVKV